MIKRVLVALFIILNLYAILCGGLYFFQENLLFHPQQLPVDYVFEFDQPSSEIWLDAADGARLNGLHFEVKNPKGVILYYHGNAGSLARWGDIVGFFVKKQFSVIVMDYRQYGKSGGTLSQDNLYEDSLLWYAFAKAQYPKTPMTVYGRSLGTTFAAYVASQKAVEQLILETPFYSIEDEAHARFPILPTGSLLKYKFPTYTFVSRLRTNKVTIFHGTEDNVVDYEHGKRMYGEIRAENKTFITIPNGGHNNLIDFEEYRNGIEKRLIP